MWSDWKRFIVEDFDPVVYAGTLLLLGVLMGLHYGAGWFGPMLRDPSLFGLAGRAALFGGPWAFVLALMVWRGRVKLTLPLVRMGLAAILIVSVATWFPYVRSVLWLVPGELRIFVRALLWNAKGAIFWVVPVVIYWLRYDRGVAPACYGLQLPHMHRRLYAVFLSVTVLVAAWASFREDFLAMYPTYFPGSAERFLGVSPWLTVGLYELVYGVDFAFVELFFRGFMVIGLARWLGTAAVMPMVAMYAVAHVGKPMPEMLGSIVGGYVLGMLAYQSRSIAGGVVLHLGMAWSMEGAALLQHLARGTFSPTQ